MARSIKRAVTSAFFLTILVGTANVAAHSALVKASPGPNDVVTTVPAELVATFDQDLDPARSSIELRDASGARLALGGRDPDRRRVMRLTLPGGLAAGRYTVRWTTFSTEDGELARETYTFTVARQATASPSASPSLAATLSPTAAPATESAPPASSTPSLLSSASPSGGGTPTTGSADTVASLVPIGAAVVIVGLFGFWLVRRNRP